MTTKKKWDAENTEVDIYVQQDVGWSFKKKIGKTKVDHKVELWRNPSAFWVIPAHLHTAGALYF